MDRFYQGLVVLALLPSTSAFLIHSQSTNTVSSSASPTPPSLSVPLSSSYELYAGRTDYCESERYEKVLGSVFCSLVLGTIVTLPLPALSASLPSAPEDTQGLEVVTQSELGKSVRGSIIRGAQLADSIDLKWERFSDSLRDEAKCDPTTGRRMFDNGFRRDGTRIGNPVLGALCTPEPLKELDANMSTLVMDLGRDAAASVLNIDKTALQKKESEIGDLVGPAFQRAAKSQSTTSTERDTQESKRQLFNRDIYIESRTFGDLVPDNKSKRETSRSIERSWGDKMLATLSPKAGRQDYNSPFPKPDPTDEQPYDEQALLDALGKVSVTLAKLQNSGIIGHWEISIPEDDDWNVVTIAIDDDISIGGQIISRERNQPLSGSLVVALVRSAMETEAKIPYKMDTFFIDPTTTRQELYNPSQLLISLSDLGQ